MIRTGIIGLGKMGISHTAILGAHPDINLVAVCDSSPLIIDVFRKYSKFETFSDYKKMIDTMNLDALFIASPTRFHVEMANYAIDRHIHLFCEKPLALDFNDGFKLAMRAGQLKLVNQVGYHNRFLSTFIEAKNLISKGLLGDLYHFTGESYGPVVLKEKVRPGGQTGRQEAAVFTIMPLIQLTLLIIC